ncbi:BnaAnng09550D [Brassica napus]|uniref:BnaAnng09550D protein n=1 Tax=Brassica napus TaxID=3708 RepID=A0A078IFH1_BRANA|nr:BnaAnng09550D [Brassica napus]
MNMTSRYDPKHMSRQTKPSDTPSSSPSRSHRRHPLLQRSLSSPSPNATCGGSTPAEFCGGTTASCAAVWCCCPCGIVNLVVLAVYKVPRGICRRALRSHRRKQLVKNGILPPLPSGERVQRVFQNSEFAIFPLDSNDVSEEEDDVFFDPKYFGKGAAVAAELTTDEETDEEDEAVLALEKEMWNRFYGAGFWRSPSQRESVSSPRVSKSLSASPRPSFTEVFRNTAIRGGATVTPRAVWQ